MSGTADDIMRTLRELEALVREAGSIRPTMLIANAMMPVGKAGLRRDGVIVFVGTIAECGARFRAGDEVMLSPWDFKRINGNQGGSS